MHNFVPRPLLPSSPPRRVFRGLAGGVEMAARPLAAAAAGAPPSLGLFVAVPRAQAAPRGQTRADARPKRAPTTASPAPRRTGRACMHVPAPQRLNPNCPARGRAASISMLPAPQAAHAPRRAVAAEARAATGYIRKRRPGKTRRWRLRMDSPAPLTPVERAVRDMPAALVALGELMWPVLRASCHVIRSAALEEPWPM